MTLILAMGSNDNNWGRGLFGDLNNDGEVNIADLNVLVDVILNGQPQVNPDPVAEHTPNMTIAEFKAKHWQDNTNYIDTVTENEVIHGWVTSSDEAGNIYKTLYIADESGEGLAISVNKTALYQDFPIGQEIVLPMQGYFVGKYNGMQQLGYPAWYQQGQTWEATYLPAEMWEDLVELNGAPDPNRAEVQPVDINLSDLQGDSETLLQYQGRLVRIKGVTFNDADGTTTYSTANASTNRTVTDKDGNTLVVRNSNYADFATTPLPEGEVDIVGLLGVYRTTWQLYLRSLGDVVSSDDNHGTLDNPYTVAMAITSQNNGNGWVSGYAVGAVLPEVTTVSGNGDIEWAAPTILSSTIVLADDPNCKDTSKCVIVPLPQGSPFRLDANLKDHPEFYQKVILVKGNLANYMGQAGVIVQNGSSDEYQLPFMVNPMLDESFDTELPANWSNVVVSGDKMWYHTAFQGNGYAAVTGYKGNQPPFDAWLISPAIDIKNATDKVLTFTTQVAPYTSSTTVFEVYVLNSNDPTAATVKVKLNPILASPPATSTYSEVTPSGDIDLSQWADGCYYIGFRYYATPDVNYATWCLDNVRFNVH